MNLIKKLRNRFQAQLDPFLDKSLYPLFKENPFVIYDVGAQGDLYQPIVGSNEEFIRIYGFEPVEVSYDKLREKYKNDQRVKLKKIALCDRDERIDFCLNINGPVTYSSLIPNEAIGLHHNNVKVEGARLDSVPSRYDFPEADFIKLDTEGSELMILQSGREMLKHVMGVCVEIFFWRKGTSGAVFHELDKLMTDNGFVLYDMQLIRSHISGIGGKKDKLRSGDALYLKDFSTCFSNIDSDYLKIKLLKLITLCVNWRYLNYAIELLDYGLRNNLVEEVVFNRVMNDWSTVMDLSDKTPNFPYQNSLAYFFDICASALNGAARKGVPRTFNSLGNSLDITVRGKQRKQARIFYPVLHEGVEGIIKTVDLHK